MLSRNFLLLAVWILFVVFSPGTGVCQTKKIDSLKLVLVNAKEDTGKVNILNSLSRALYVCDELESSLQFAQQQLSLSKKLRYQRGEAYALLNIASCNIDKNKLEEADAYYKLVYLLGHQMKDKKIIGITYANFGNVETLKGNYMLAIRKFDTALIYYREIGDKEHIAHTMANMAMNYYDQNNYPEAIKHLYMAIRYWEEMGDKINLRDCYTGIGNIQVEQGNYQEALNEYKKALDINLSLSANASGPSLFKGDAAMSLSKIGEVYLLMGKPDSAFIKFNDALAILNDTKFSVDLLGGKSMCYTGLGKIYELRGDSARKRKDIQNAELNFSLANANYTQSLKLYIEEGYGKRSYENDIPGLYILLGNINIKRNNYLQAGKWLKQALALSAEKKARPQLRDSYLNLSRFYEVTGNSGEAYKTYKNYILYRDSIVNEDGIRKTEGYKMQYDFNKKEDSLNQRQIVTETKLTAQKRQRYFYWAGLALLALLSFFIFLTFRNQKKIHRLAGASHSKEKAELELQSLRAQLNPHFMFNSLNAIQELILLEENEKSQSYLARFSKLLRMLLENAERPFIPLQREIDFLQLYLSLENLRIPDLQYSINVDPGIDTEQTAIPNMILQPYIENAIWHGLSHKQSDRELRLRITKANGVVQYEIEDNGVGRKKSAELKSLFRKEHKSKGMELLSKRFKLLAKEYGSDIDTTIADVMRNDEVTGTLVTIKVSVEFSEELKNNLNKIKRA